MNFCSNCGSSALEHRVPNGDTMPRWVCSSCGAIHYQNPKAVVGCLPVWNQQVLLCKRAIEPRLGLWTLPAGFLEIGESVADGAARETSEEAGAQFELQELYTLINVVKVAQIHLFHRARLLSPEFDPGPETLEARLFHEHEVPWDQIAFRTTRMTLEHFFEDRRAGRGFPVHTGDI